MTKIYQEEGRPESGAVIINNNGSVELMGRFEYNDPSPEILEFLRYSWTTSPSGVASGADLTLNRNASEKDIAKVKKLFPKGLLVPGLALKKSKNSEFTLHYGNAFKQLIEGKQENPIGAMHLSGNKILLVGNRNWVNDWERYFSTEGWKKHLKEDNPLEDLLSGSAYTDDVLSDESGFSEAREVILSGDGIEKLVTWQTL